jgi:serine/threonine-protein kinase RsbW
MTETSSVTLVLPASLEHLDTLRMSLQDMLEKLPSPPDLAVIYQVQLAASEIYANIIEHACKFDVNHRVRIHFQVDEQRSLTLRFRDEGASFMLDDLRQRKSEPATDERGMGLTITRQLVDDLRYEAHPDYNEWRLVKHLHSDETPHACHSAG